jgi:hypothetical protein
MFPVSEAGSMPRSSTGPAVFVIEFKCGEKRFTTDAYNQSWDYALDLKKLPSGEP